MTRYRTALVLLVVALLAGGALRAWLIAAKRTLNHDEAISYLCAAGKQGLYRECMLRQAPPFGAWVPAADLKGFFEPQSRLCFERIGRDLAETDIHPPLYFWLLHVWRLAFGLYLWTGPALNALLAAVGAVLLFVIARALLRDDLAATAVSAVWWLSPAVVATCFEARHYDLLALMTIAFVGALWAVLGTRRAVRGSDGRGCEGPAADAPSRPHTWLLLALATAGGLLTHYHFVLLLVFAVPWIWLRTVRDRQRALNVAAAITVGVAIFVTVHPQFLASILRAREQAQGFDPADVPARVQTTLLTYAGFFVRAPTVTWLMNKHWSMLALGAGAVATLLVWLLMRGGAKRTAPADRLLGYLFLTLAGVNVGLYVIGVSPRHAMGPQYPAMVWPLLAGVVVKTIQSLPRGRGILLATLPAALLLASGHATGREVRKWQNQPDPAAFLARAPAVVIDNTARGILPAIVWHIPDDCPVLAASREYLLKHPQSWLTELPPQAVVITVSAYGNEVSDERYLLELLRAQFELAGVERGVFGVGRVHVLLPKEHAAACAPPG